MRSHQACSKPAALSAVNRGSLLKSAPSKPVSKRRSDKQLSQKHPLKWPLNLTTPQKLSVQPKRRPAVSLCVSVGLGLSAAQSHAGSWFEFEPAPKRFSVSAGWLHVMPETQTNNFNNTTQISQGYQASVGKVSKDAVLDAVDTSSQQGQTQKQVLEAALLADAPLAALGLGVISTIEDQQQFLKPSASGEAVLNGLGEFSSANTGLYADQVDTLGLTASYHMSDNWSLQFVGGFPPKVDIKGKGVIEAPLSGVASPSGIAGLVGDIDLRQDLYVTDLEQSSTAATARAWTPALELQYSFGKSGVNKFRPFVGAGVTYAYFNELEMNPQIESDLITAGHMIRNIQDNQAGAALDRLESSGSPSVRLKSSDSFAPRVSAGATYDFNENWFAVAQASYTKLSTDVEIDVVDETTGSKLLGGKTTIDINPLMTYVGVGYRF